MGNFLVRIVLQSKTDCAIIIGVEYIKTKIRALCGKVGCIDRQREREKVETRAESADPNSTWEFSVKSRMYALH